MSFPERATEAVHLTLDALPPLPDLVQSLLPPEFLPVVWFTLAWMSVNVVFHLLSFVVARPYRSLPASEKIAWAGWGTTTVHTFVILTLCYPCVEELRYVSELYGSVDAPPWPTPRPHTLAPNNPHTDLPPNPGPTPGSCPFACVVSLPPVY